MSKYINIHGGKALFFLAAEDRSLTMYKEKTQMPNSEARRGAARSPRAAGYTSDYSPVGDMPLYRGKNTPYKTAETQEKNRSGEGGILGGMLNSNGGRRRCDGSLRERNDMPEEEKGFPFCGISGRRDGYGSQYDGRYQDRNLCKNSCTGGAGVGIISPRNEMNSGCPCQPDCTTDRCGGWGLSSHPLAMVYSPCQAWRDAYAPDVALCRGTLFSELDLPFEGKMAKRGCLS